jgi:hypothetical protein
MKNLLKLLLSAVFLFGVTPTNAVAQEVVEQQCTTAKQCCEIVLADADVKKKKKKKGKKLAEKGKKKKKGFFSKVFGSK